jgi:PAS domain S-box-containing protein
MKRSRSIVGFAVAVSAVVLGSAGWMAHVSVERLSDTGDAVKRARQIELAYERLLSVVRGAETGQRGYLLTSDARYLVPYDAALRDVAQRVDALQARVRADGGSVADIAPLRTMVTRRMDELARTLDMDRAGDHVGAVQRVRTGEGRLIQAEIRQLISARVLEQQQRVAQLAEIEEAALDAAIRMGILVSALAVALMILLLYIVRRDTDRVRASENRLAITLRSIGDAVIATDERGLVTMVNPVAEVLTGWSTARAKGRPLDDIFCIVNEDTRARVESPVSKVLREGGIVGLANHTVLIRPDGKETAIEDSAAPILDDAGHITGVVLVFRDATKERAHNKALHDADRRKDEFLATLSHELRNPLAPIRQAATTAGHPSAKPEQVRWSLDVIKRQVSHMARLLDDLLDVSRITRGHLEVRRTRVPLKSLVESAVEIAQPSIDAGQHRLSVELPEEALELEVDSVRIAQVFGNLLTNAAKYTPAGGSILLRAERAGEEVVVRVIDNGIGLEQADVPRIFEMFTQVSPTDFRPLAGLGIGLALAKALVELHGGSIDARSAGPGKGSEFVVRLAIAPLEARAAA